MVVVVGGAVVVGLALTFSMDWCPLHPAALPARSQKLYWVPAVRPVMVWLVVGAPLSETSVQGLYLVAGSAILNLY